MRILYDPAPRKTSEIFTPDSKTQFFADHDVVEVNPSCREAVYSEHLPKTEILISQQPMEKAQIDAAENLRAIFNVETNFLPNIDYDACFERGVHVLTPASVFAVPVAEMGLGLALSLLRDIHGAHTDFLSGHEVYGLDGNGQAKLLSDSSIGLIGFGDLGRALQRLLTPFGAQTRVFDPWLPADYLRRQGVEPASLNDVLGQSSVVFVTAAVTAENEKLLDRKSLAVMPDGANLVLLSRAALADFDALSYEAQSGRLRIATDVFPTEPVAKDDPIRKTRGILFSPHRAGALHSALTQIGALVLEDIGQIARNLPPVSCRRAERETVQRLRSKPIEVS
ncbi:NAD(P)-dependent oxidoreductase [Pseudopelagicola sp. nBUS_19]|uniref:NAD(P)-dependent oxidoreductase n=1 Tax=unclassified Pseudopelagicola TaxID=2649563 RepID=UPI003EB6E991